MLNDSMLRYHIPVYERKHQYYWFNGHMSWYNYIMDDFGNSIERVYPYDLYANSDWLQYEAEDHYTYRATLAGRNRP